MHQRFITDFESLYEGYKSNDFGRIKGVLCVRVALIQVKTFLVSSFTHLSRFLSRNACVTGNRQHSVLVISQGSL